MIIIQYLIKVNGVFIGWVGGEAVRVSEGGGESASSTQAILIFWKGHRNVDNNTP